MGKKIIISLLFLSVLLTCCEQETAQNNYTIYTSYKPYARWWWFSGDVDTTDIKGQLDWLLAQGFGGVEIEWAALPGDNDTIAVESPLLSQKWSDAMAFTKGYADSLGLGTDFSFGNLGYNEKIEYRRYTTKIDRVLKNGLNGTFSGIFADSWEVDSVYLLPDGFERKFLGEYRYDIVPYLTDSTLYNAGNEAVYYDYMKLLSVSILGDFYGSFAQNATSIGSFSRSKVMGLQTDLLEAYSLVDIPETQVAIYGNHFVRIAASAAALANKQAVSAESFSNLYGEDSLSGQPLYLGKEQIADLKLSSDALLANGVNQIIWQGMPFRGSNDTLPVFYGTTHLGPDANFLAQLPGFNQYLTTVSGYMRMGKSYSDIAVYFPIEDLWMAYGNIDSAMGGLVTPRELKGRQPIWVNNQILSSAGYTDSLLTCGESLFSSLYVDVEYLDFTALKTIYKLAKQGLPVVLSHDVLEPGTRRSTDYARYLYNLQSLENVATEFSILEERGFIKHHALVEGSNIPDYWCRADNGEFYIFFANPRSQDMKYPLEYKQGLAKSTVNIPVTFNANGRVSGQMLTFKPNQSLLFKIDKEGNVENIDITFNTPEIK